MVDADSVTSFGCYGSLEDRKYPEEMQVWIAEKCLNEGTDGLSRFKVLPPTPSPPQAD